MFGGIPAVCGHVDATARGHLVVNDDDFLVVAASHRMRTVEFELDLLVHCPFGDIHHSRPPCHQLKRTEIPFKQLDFQPRRPVGQPQNEITKPFWRVAFFPAAPA